MINIDMKQAVAICTNFQSSQVGDKLSCMWRGDCVEMGLGVCRGYTPVAVIPHTPWPWGQMWRSPDTRHVSLA